MINRFIILGCMLILSNCATVKTSEQIAAENKQMELATRTFLECISQKVKYMDDGISDASTIAFALTNSCNAEYNALILAFASTLDNDNQKNIFMRKRNSRDGKIASSIDIVLGYRNGTLLR